MDVAQKDSKTNTKHIDQKLNIFLFSMFTSLLKYIVDVADRKNCLLRNK